MRKTIKKNKTHNKTKKIKYKLKGNKLILRKDCPINLKPFEELYQKEFRTNKSYNMLNDKFVKYLLSRFSPSSIKPENDYYSYINYKWLKDISVKKQQQYNKTNPTNNTTRKCIFVATLVPDCLHYGLSL